MRVTVVESESESEETGTGRRAISQGRPIERIRLEVWVAGLSQARVVRGGRRVDLRMERPRVVRSEAVEK